MMDNDKFIELCAIGDDSTRDYINGDYESALEKCHIIMETMLNTSNVDSFLVSKATLNILLFFIKVNQCDDAFSIWKSDKDSLYSYGIEGLENGQVSSSDTILYLQVCAFLKAEFCEVPVECAKEINSLYERILIFCEIDRKDLLYVMLNNWHLHLKKIFYSDIPKEFIEPLASKFEYNYKKAVLKEIQFLIPSRWEISWNE